MRGYRAIDVVELLGGCKAVAERLGLTERAIQYWLNRPDGSIPREKELLLKYEVLTAGEKRKLGRIQAKREAAGG